MGVTRRAMLLALGASLAIVDLPADQLDVPAPAAAFGGGTLTIQDISISSYRERIDVTCYGDAHPRFMPGIVHTTFHITAILDDALEAALAQGALEFDDIVAGARVTAPLMVMSHRPFMLENGLMAVAMEATAIGPVTVHPRPATLAALSEVRRAMNLSKESV